MPTPSTQPDEVAEAESAVTAAEADVATVEKQLLAGDPAASAGDLVSAEKAADERRSILDRARDIARKRQVAAAEQARLDRIAELRELAGSMGGRKTFESMVAAFDKAVAALVAMAKTGVAYNDDVTYLGRELRAVAPLPSGIDAPAQRVRVMIDGVEIAAVGVEQLLAEAVHRAFKTAGLSWAGKLDRSPLGQDVSGMKYGIGCDRTHATASMPTWGPSDVLRWRAEGCPTHEAWEAHLRLMRERQNGRLT